MIEKIKYFLVPGLVFLAFFTSLFYAQAQPGQEPDYFINSISIDPVNPTTADTITITVVVRNNGADTSIASYLQIELDDEASPPTYSVPGLAKHTNFTQTRVVGPLTQGSHTIEATADATNLLTEKDETNNVSSLQFDVLQGPTPTPTPTPIPGPDLVVSSLDHAPPDPVLDEIITITAVVENAGNEEASTSTLALDVNHETSPTLFEIPALAPAGFFQVQRQVQFSAIGDYPVDATADVFDDVSETNEENNTTTDNIHVSAPDLVVTTLTHDPASPNSLDPITISAVVANQGDAPATTSTLEVDIEGDVHSFEIPALGIGKDYQVDFQVGPLDPGSYDVTATADAMDDVNESNEANNTAQDSITVLEAPNLIVSSLTHAPINPYTTDLITITAIVKNIGGTSATTSTLEIDVNGNAANYEIPPLDPSDTFQVERYINLSVAGAYPVIATADLDDDVAESNELDNTAQDEIVVTEPPKPDLVVDSISHAPEFPIIGDTVTLKAIVKNIGEAAATTSTLELVVEGEAGPSTFTIPILAPDETFQVELPVVKSVAGTYQVTGTADLYDDNDESNEDNNVTVYEFTVREPGPDLIVDSLTHTPVNPTTLDSVTVIAVVKNVGDGAAGASTLEISVEGDATTHEIPALASMEEFEVQRNLGLLSVMTYHVTATADVLDEVEESVEDNNTAQDEIVVGEPLLPDLVIDSLDYEPDMAFTSETVTITAEVKNIGAAETTTTTLWILVGSEAVPESFQIPPLDADMSFSVQRQVMFDEPGSYLVTATADAEDAILESDETNNSDTIEILVYSNDEIKLKEYLLGKIALTSEELEFYDINQDGIVDIADLVTLILR